MKHELEIVLENDKYTDSLITALVRQGYAVYLTDEDKLAVEIPIADVKERQGGTIPEIADIPGQECENEKERV